jgi:hypothetical protein
MQTHYPLLLASIEQSMWLRHQIQRIVTFQVISLVGCGLHVANKQYNLVFINSRSNEPSSMSFCAAETVAAASNSTWA